MKVKKSIAFTAFFMMLVMVVFYMSLTATAISDKKGSITINLTDSEKDTPLANVSFRLYFIAKASKSDVGIKYDLIPPYDKTNFDISDLQDSSLPLHLVYFANSNNLPYDEKSTDENGRLVFDNLEPGIYLLSQSQSSSNDYTTTPFIISVPSYDSNNKEWKYNIDASPKFIGGDSDDEGDDTYISVVKKWVGDNSHPESVTVVLLRDFQEYDKVQLNNSNNWCFRWDNLSKDHIWSVVETEVPDGYTVYYETSSNTVTIINKSGKTEGSATEPSTDEDDKLVQTGQLNWPIPVCAISGILIFSIGWVVLNFGRKESE